MNHSELCKRSHNKASLTLDVGSGHNPRGDVNVDIFDTFADYSSNFVKADASRLPFRDKIFTGTTCIHTIEHVRDPALLIRELIRVTHGELMIRTPYRNIGFSRIKTLVRTGRNPHLWSFTKTWFAPLQKWFPKIEIEYSQFFIIPTEITVRMDTTVRRQIRRKENSVQNTR